MHIISQKLGTIYHVAITLFCPHIFWPTTDRVLSIVCSTSPSSALQYSWYESQDSTGRLQLLEIKDIQLLPDKSVWYEVLPFAIVFKLIMNQGSVALVAVWLFHSSLASFPGLQRLRFWSLAVCKNGARRPGESYHVIRSTGDVTETRHEDIFTFISPATENLKTSSSQETSPTSRT